MLRRNNLRQYEHEESFLRLYLRTNSGEAVFVSAYNRVLLI